MIKNNLCENCVHASMCKYKDFVQKFSEDSKRPMGIDIEILQCSSYEEDKQNVDFIISRGEAVAKK